MGPEEEFEDFNKNNSWAIVYETIKTKSSLLEFTSLDARRPEFRNRNRYRDVSPYDHSRVPLEREGIDYINANIVEAPDADRSYILTQGPLPNTCGHFWLMVWEQNSKAVLMLNRTLERGRVKCHQYFPQGMDDGEVEEVMEFDDVGLILTFLEETNYRYFTVRTFRLQDMKTSETKEVLQFHYTTWPDFKVPTLSVFLNYLNAVRQSGALSRDVGPPVIHCSAGIGRSGTFCLVDTCLVLIEKAGSMAGIDVQSILMGMRQYRMGLIQTADQLRFSYEAIIEGGKRILSASPDLEFSDLNDLSNGEEMIVTESMMSSNHSAAAMMTSSYQGDDSDTDIPPPLPPRQKPPPPPMLPLPDDDEDLCGDPIMHHPNGDTVEEMRELMRGLTDELEFKPESREITETQRREGVDLRRRNREKRLQATQQQIERMKKRQSESEKWRQTKTSYVTPILIGLGIAGCTGIVLFYRYYFIS